MKKLVLVLVALASLSFAADQKKEDCSIYLANGDHYVKSTSENLFSDIQKSIYASLATATYLRYQICKDLEKGK